MKLALALLSLGMLTGCATEMIGQCAMKSVSSDPLYGVGCGLAMTGTAVEGTAMLLNAAKNKIGSVSMQAEEEVLSEK